MSMDAAGWRVGIVGLGLIGGSVAQVLPRHGIPATG